MFNVEMHEQSLTDSFKHWDFIEENYQTEWFDNPEIRESFPDHVDYWNIIHRSVTGLDRLEWYIRKEGRIVGMACVSLFEDIHYRKVAGASLLWVHPDSRNDRELSRLVLNTLKASAKMGDCRYYVRTSKVTPFITKQIVRRV